MSHILCLSPGHSMSLNIMSWLCQACKLQSDEKGDSCENRAELCFVMHRFQCVTAAAGLNRAKTVKFTLDKISLLKVR